ncbi:MAG: permease [Alphaproteobacteria bacterium]|nr:permease [Alphaproteobacteria bacterium]
MTELALHGLGGLRSGARRVVSAWILIPAIPVAVAALDPARFGDILHIAIEALVKTLPFVAVAVALIAGLKATGATALVARAFEGRETRMIVLAALLGGLAPFCSCEVIPFIAALLAVGAPLSAIMAFWLSSPLIDPPTVLITAGALGWDFAVGKALAAVALGLFGGFGVRLLVWHGAFAAPLRGHAGGCDSQLTASGTLWRFWREAPRRATFRSELLTNALFLVKWLALAYLIEALLITYVPAAWIAGLVGGDGFGSVAMGALVGAPAYLNGYAAPALVAGLVEQGMSAGAAMAFMVAGSVSCIPAMVAVWSLVRRQIFAAYVAFGIAGAVLFGTLFAAVVG